MTLAIHSLTAQVTVELDIFSGMPNPTWDLGSVEAETFAQKLAALPPNEVQELIANLGYRGLIVRYMGGSNAQVVHIQNGIAHIWNGASRGFASDQQRALERWLLTTGRRYLTNEIFEIVDRELS